MKRLTIIPLSLLMMSALISCSGLSQREERVLTGTAIGAGAGTAVGAATDEVGTAEGAAAGAAAGAAGGLITDEVKD
jgi:uncharacterized protein YcfJ